MWRRPSETRRIPSNTELNDAQSRQCQLATTGKIFLDGGNVRVPCSSVVAFRQKQFAQMLISPRPDFHLDSRRCTPLHYAAGAGNLGLCRRLVQHGAKVNTWDFHYYTAVDYARQSGAVDCVAYLEEVSASSTSTNAGEPGSVWMHVTGFIEYGIYYTRHFSCQMRCSRRDLTFRGRLGRAPNKCRATSRECALKVPMVSHCFASTLLVATPCDSAVAEV